MDASVDRLPVVVGHQRHAQRPIADVRVHDVVDGSRGVEVQALGSPTRVIPPSWQEIGLPAVSVQIFCNSDVRSSDNYFSNGA